MHDDASRIGNKNLNPRAKNAIESPSQRRNFTPHAPYASPHHSQILVTYSSITLFLPLSDWAYDRFFPPHILYEISFFVSTFFFKKDSVFLHAILHIMTTWPIAIVYGRSNDYIIFFPNKLLRSYGLTHVIFCLIVGPPSKVGI